MTTENFELKLDLEEVKAVFRGLSQLDLKEIKLKQLFRKIETIVQDNCSISEFEDLIRGEYE